MKPRSILDVGCGTGVLAIAAAILTRSPAIASDIDPEAIPVARDNAVINATGRAGQMPACGRHSSPRNPP
jgi:ribosomal protein L11 methyltransferase